MAAIAHRETTEKAYHVRLVDDLVVEKWYGLKRESANCICYDTEAELLAAHPELQPLEDKIRKNKLKGEIDNNSGVRIDKAHLAKAHEAELVKFELITTPPERFPYLHQEAIDKNMDIGDLADEVWAKHVSDAQMDNKRIKDKGQVS